MKTQTISEQSAFVCSDGQKLQTLAALVHKLESITEDVFVHHVNPHKNDFANWIEDVFKEPMIATEVKNQSSARDMAIVIKRALKTPKNDIHHTHIHHKIKHMTKQLDHLTKYEDRTPANEFIAPVTEDIRDKLVDFLFGLAIGLILGIVIVKSITLF